MPVPDYLLALSPRTDALSLYGAARKSVISPMPNPKTQPPRIYSLLATGGGVIFDEDVALALKGAGFNVVPFDPRPEELAWLVKTSPDFAKAQNLWAVSCDGKPVYLSSSTGGRRCGAPPELIEISEHEALTSGAATQADLQEALKYVSPKTITGYVYYGTKPGVTASPGVIERALASIRGLERIAAKIRALNKTQKQIGRPMLPSVENRIARASRTLATFAQPNAELRRGYATLRRNLIAAKAPGAGRLPADPFPSFGVAAVAAVPVSTVVALAFIAVIAVAGVAAAFILADSYTQVVAAQTDLDKAEIEQRQQAVDCVTDPTRTHRQRRQCGRLTREITKQSEERTKRNKDANPFAQLTDALKFVVPLAAVGFTAVYFGPVIAEATSAAAQRIEDWRRRK
jgi:hypothetical protein